MNLRRILKGVGVVAIAAAASSLLWWARYERNLRPEELCMSERQASSLRNRSALIRKSMDYGLLALREIYRPLVDRKEFRRRPPLICNSIPKSGTHLLLQVARTLPNVRHWGNFIASTPSVTLREQSEARQCARLNRLLPGEVLGAHIYHSPGRASAMRAKNVCHLFIYRDPRDVVVSEAHYLADMNRWHRLHPIMKRLPTHEDRMLALIEGIPGLYPDLKTRIERYLGWVSESDTLAIRYEDLVGEAREEVVGGILRHYLSRSSEEWHEDRLLGSALQAMVPHRSHTFRTGGSGGWRREFTDRVQLRFEMITGDLLLRMGYMENTA